MYRACTTHARAQRLPEDKQCAKQNRQVHHYWWSLTPSQLFTQIGSQSELLLARENTGNPRTQHNNRIRPTLCQRAVEHVNFRTPKHELIRTSFSTHRILFEQFWQLQSLHGTSDIDVREDGHFWRACVQKCSFFLSNDNLFWAAGLSSVWPRLSVSLEPRDQGQTPMLPSAPCTMIHVQYIILFIVHPWSKTAVQEDTLCTLQCPCSSQNHNQCRLFASQLQLGKGTWHCIFTF